MENLALGNSLVHPSLCGTVHERASLVTDVLVVAVVLADAVLHYRLQNVERSTLQVSGAAFGLILSFSRIAAI